MPERTEPPEGQFGPYRLIQRIATGGMAEIHLASTKGFEGFEKLVALKMIHPNFSSDDHFVQMLIDEAKISVQLQHVNVAHVFDLGKVGDTYYIAMEFVDGCDLFKVLRQAADQDRYMPLETACYIAKEVCAGLDYAHHKRDAAGRSMGIVHRDVSPQNVLLSHAGEVKIVDFGIAKATMRARQTAVGVIKGKYYYMSPEQAWGDPVDHRTDIFSAGILLYEMLTGRMLYLEEDMNKLLDMVRKANIPPPSTKRPEVPRELDRIVMRALSKKPDMRWQSAQDFGTAIERFLHGFAPDFNAQKLAAFVNEVVPPAPPPVPEKLPEQPAPVRQEARQEARQEETARVARQSIMVSRSEFSDENSVIYRLGERPEPTEASEAPKDEEILRGKPPAPTPRGGISPNRLTTPAASPAALPARGKRAVSPNRLTTPSGPPPISTQATPVVRDAPALRSSPPPSVSSPPLPAPFSRPPASPPTLTIDETRAAKTLVTAAPAFETGDGGTIELSADMLEPVDDLEDAAASPTLRTPELTPGLPLDAEPDRTPDHRPVHTPDHRPDQTSDVATEVAAPPAPARQPEPLPAPTPAPAVLSAPVPVLDPSSAPAAASSPPRRSKRTPGAGIAVPAPLAARLVDSSPRAPSSTSSSSLPLPPKEESGPLMVPPAAVWPPRPRQAADLADLANLEWAEDDFFGMRIGRFDRRKLLMAAAIIAVTVGLGALVVAAFAGAPPVGARDDATLEIISVPEKAHVFADGRDLGPSPVKLDHLPIGKPVKIRIEREEYQPWERTMTPSEANDLKMAASLKPILGTLRVDSSPPGAEVFFDNRSLGSTPLIRTDMNPFVDGTVEVRKEGRRPSRQGLRWDGQREANLKFELQSAPSQN